MKRLIAFMLALVLVLSMFGCNGDPAPAAPTEAPTDPAIAAGYVQSAAPLRQAPNLKMSLTVKKTVTTGGSVSSSVSTQDLVLTGIGTDDFVALMYEELNMGEYWDTFTEYYKGGTLYVNIYDSGYFSGDMTGEDFLARFAPAVLLDESLYRSIVPQETESGTTLTFSDPVGPETWALPQGAKFVSGGGTTKIDADGTLTQTVYTLSYVHGGATVAMEITSDAYIYKGNVPAAPKDLDNYQKVDSLEALRYYETAVLHIFSCDTLSSSINQTIVCQAAGYTQLDQTELHYIGLDAGHQSLVKQGGSAIYSTGETSTYSLTEKFQNGLYSYCQNSSSFIPNYTVSATDMVAYLQDMCDDMPALSYISSAKTEDVNGLICIEFGLTQEWNKLTMEWLCELLFEDENYLDNYATKYEAITSSYYIVIDPATGFPVSAGYSYNGAHTIEGAKYILSQESNQSYRLGDSSTYTELTGKNPEETAPAQQATPLLYRVTGPNGQEMYLLGTIHVGDAKTAFLPEAFYAAFDACDALAVEVDVIAFEDKLENSSVLASQLAALYTYSDQSPTKEHLEPELYENAIKLLKAAGAYSSSMEFVMPYAWANSIEGFYLTLGGLRTEKGMDMRLLMLAKEQQKKVLEVESTLSQYEMYANFSPELQELLLTAALEVNATEYCDEVQSLYDLWCTGDEEALRACLAEDGSDMTDAEKACYQEYIDAMIVQRNSNMLNVAVSYLEGKDTVFFAVGLAHLLQENGLVDALRQAGYAVEQVVYG